MVTIKKIKSRKTKLLEIEQRTDTLEEAMKKSNDEILARAIQDMLKRDTLN